MMFEDIEDKDFHFIDGLFLYVRKGNIRRWIPVSDLVEVCYNSEEKKLYVHYKGDDD